MLKRLLPKNQAATAFSGPCMHAHKPHSLKHTQKKCACLRKVSKHLFLVLHFAVCKLRWNYCGITASLPTTTSSPPALPLPLHSFRFRQQIDFTFV